MANVSSDPNIKHANLLIIAETWTIRSHPSATNDTPEFTLAKQYNAPSPYPATRPHLGILIYAKTQLIRHYYFHKDNVISLVINFEVHTGIQLVNMLGIYRHPAQKQDVSKKNEMDTEAVEDFYIRSHLVL